ncbi:MAG: hypothetical protein ACOY31_00385 [Bacillota bacterium]
MEGECSLIKHFTEKYRKEIEEIIKREQVSPEVAVCSYLCPDVIGCIEDVEDKACAIRLRMIGK